MARNQVAYLLIFGVILHVLYLSSVFYIYFKSPIIQGLKSVKVASEFSSAERLVLFVADGLRADKVFHINNENETSFLRTIIKEKGRWGVSHTRVPTESRVGHVSMMAGTYEDVSAITNGWKDNPVEFDSFFNQSYKTWCWGSPDILNIFKRQTNRNFQAYSYNSEEIDFASKDPSMLDTWVFDNVNDFLLASKSSSALHNELHRKKSVFFLHLLGIDTNGHAKKPDSIEYLKNIEIVDRGIRNMTLLFENFFGNDGKTAYVVTSDHGMTPWGAHGTGLQSETETPFIAWGAGITKPIVDRNINKDTQSMVWGLEDYKRTDINQIDLAPLMSFLIGTSFPANSVGKLPIDVLDVNIREKALGMLHNTKQIKEQYDAHENKIKQSAFKFTPFPDFNEDLMPKISTLVQGAKFEEAINLSNQWIEDLLQGIDYYHRYNRLSLSICVNAAFVMWLVLLLVTVLHEYSNFTSSKQVYRGSVIRILKSRLFILGYLVITLVLALLLYLRSKDSSYVMYTFLPLLIWAIVLTKFDMLWNVVCHFKKNIHNGKMVATLVYFIVVAIGLEIMVNAFFNRQSLSIISVCLAFVPWLKVINEDYSKYSTGQKCICFMFTLTSIALGYFPQLPVIQREHKYMLVVLAAFLISTFGLMYSFFVKDANSNVIALQTALVIACAVVKMHSVRSIDHGNGLPLTNQLFSWSIVMLLPLLVFLTDPTSTSRLVSTILSLHAIYILTSISYESLFLLALTVQMLTWIGLETEVFTESSMKTEVGVTKDVLTMDHLRIAFMFVYFILMSFFGTGNVASINSFDIASTYCFQTVFNPWIQGMVLSLKVLIPLLMVTVIFRSMHSMTSLPMRGLFLLILFLTDLMTMHFFFLVKDEGSWLDIGQSLSHFIINLAFVIFLVPVYEISYYVTGSISKKTLKTHTL